MFVCQVTYVGRRHTTAPPGLKLDVERYWRETRKQSTNVER